MNGKAARGRFIASFLAPAFALYGIFVLWPLVQAFQISLYQWRGTSDVVRWRGLENYRELATDKVVAEAVGNNLYMLGVGGLLIFALALLFSHAVLANSRLSRAFESIALFPQVASTVVVALLWQFMFHPQFGPIPLLQKSMGLGEFESGWLATPSVALPAVTVAFVWFATGFYILLFTAGLRQIPGEVNEAATLDGCQGWRRFASVTWPLLWSIRRTAVTYLVITVMNTFALVYLMTKGAPDRRTEVMLTYLYELAFTNSEWGSASALAVVNFLLVMALAFGVRLLFRRDPTAART
ncbi:MAG: sugar ABC transporter permease [Fimbriimonadaceae bacterium]|nr:sugar ABC transporter permease [Fimbriimonadaceae bacterium]